MNAPDRAALLAASLDDVHIAQSRLDDETSINRDVLQRYLVDRTHLPPPIVEVDDKPYAAPTSYSIVDQTWVKADEVIRDKYLKLMLSRQGVEVSTALAISQIGRIVEIEEDIHAGVARARLVLPTNHIGHYEDQGFSTHSLMLKWTIEKPDTFKRGDFVQLDLSNRPFTHKPGNAVWIQTPTKVSQPEINPFLYVDPALSKLFLLLPESTHCLYLPHLIEIQARMFSLMCLPDRQLSFAQLTRTTDALDSYCTSPSSTTSHDCSASMNLLHTLEVQANVLIEYERRSPNVHMDLSLLLLTAWEHDFTKYQEYVELSTLQYWLSEVGVLLGHDRSLPINIIMAAGDVAYPDSRLAELCFALGFGRGKLKNDIGELVAAADRDAAEKQSCGINGELINDGILRRWELLEVIQQSAHKGGTVSLGLNNKLLSDVLGICPTFDSSQSSASSSVTFTTTPTTAKVRGQGYSTSKTQDGGHHG